MNTWAKLLKSCLILASVLTISNSYSQAIDHSDSGNNENIENLTDADRHLKDNYVDQGLSERTMKELCAKDGKTQKACDNRKAEKKVLGMDPTLVQGVAKAYTMIMGLGSLSGDKSSDKSDTDTDTDTDTGDATDEADSKTPDYCKYIPMVTETIATLQQTNDQDSIKNLPVKHDSVQIESLYKAEQSHRARADNSKTQRNGWMATTVCYAGYAAAGQATKSTYLKLGAAGFLGYFFGEQVGAHEDYADAVKDVIAEMPGKGDCNPITDRNCFCSQKENQYHPKYCKDLINQRKMAETSIAVSCVDDKMKADPSCKCAATNTCYDQKFMSNIKGLNFPGALTKDGLSPFNALTKGELKGGKLTNGSAKQFAVADKALKDNINKLGPPSKPLSKSQKAEAKALVDAFGINKNLASHIAAQPVNKKAIAKFANGSRSNKYGNNRKKYKKNSRNKVLTFGGGGGINQRKKKSSSDNNFFKNFGKKKKRSKSSGKVMKFAQRAAKSAQITRNKDRPLFEIISRRYQVSGWRRLEVLK